MRIEGEPVTSSRAVGDTGSVTRHLVMLSVPFEFTDNARAYMMGPAPLNMQNDDVLGAP